MQFHYTPVLSALACLCMVSTISAAPGIRGRIEVKQKGQDPMFVEAYSYNRSTRTYKVRKRNVTMSLARNKVEYVRPPKPRGLDTTKSTVALERIMAVYRGSVWEAEAARRLFPLYVKANAYAKAIDTYKALKKDVGEALPIDLRREYWSALLQSKRKHTLRKELTLTIERGPREACAWAYVMRGDLLLAEGNPKEALLDGYMKVAILFKDIKSCRKQALKKTIGTLENLGDTRSEKFRRMLYREYPAEVDNVST